MTDQHEIGAWDRQHGTAHLSISGSPIQLIRIGGDVDLANAHDIERGVGTAYQADVHHVVVDLHEITYLDSAGLAMLVRISSRFAAARTVMIVVAPPDSVAHRVIELSGLGAQLALRNDWRDEALPDDLPG